MDEIVNQEQLKSDLDEFDIDDYLFQKKEQLDQKINDYRVRIKALKLIRSKK